MNYTKKFYTRLLDTKWYMTSTSLLGVIMSSVTIDDILDNIEFGYSWIDIKIPGYDIKITIYPLAWRYIFYVEYKEAELYFSRKDKVKRFINAIANNNTDVILFSQLITYMDVRTRYNLSYLLTELNFGEEQMGKIIKSKYLSILYRLREYYNVSSVIEHMKHVHHIIRQILQRHHNNEYIRKYCKKILELTDEERLEAYIISRRIK